MFSTPSILRLVLLLLLAVLGPVSQILAQEFGEDRLEVSSDYTTEQLVREIFATDRCETIFNVKRIGSSDESMGYFAAPEDILTNGDGKNGFREGIVLSTGRISDALGPNVSTTTSTEMAGPTPDPDLDIASRGQINDRSGFEFDFVPLTSKLTFRYVFASEEYCEFVDATFNDIFGFFISGPGLNGPFSDGAINIARVPGTNQPVSINTINYRNNSDFYLDNESPEVRQTNGCGGPSGAGPRQTKIEYDGQTVILTATVDVIPCETYHMRLVVADVRDDELDSAVFLEAGSFDLGSSATLQDENDAEAPITLYEGCSSRSMRVVRGPESDTSRAQIVNYRVGSLGEASEVSDFDAGPGRVTIPRGQQFVDVPLRAFADTTSEGSEEAYLILDADCACFSDSVRIVIQEQLPLEVDPADDYLYCPGTSNVLDADHRGGVPPFSYEWNFGSTEANPRVNFDLPDTVAVRITDACGASVEWRTGTRPSPPPSISFPDQDLSACWGETIDIVTELEGEGPFAVNFRVNGGLVQTKRFPNAGRVNWPATEGGTYQITSVVDEACGTETRELFEVNFMRPSVKAEYTDPTCHDAADGTIEIRHRDTRSPYTYRLNDRPVSGLKYEDLMEGSYRIEVTDSSGCQAETSVELLGPPALRPIQITCGELRRTPLRLSAEGGNPPYAYSTDRLSYSSADLFTLLKAGSIYNLFIRDASGCELEQPFFYLPQPGPASVDLPPVIGQQIGGSTEVELDLLVPENQLATYEWAPAELFDCPTCARPTVSAPYSQPVRLVVRDIFGCTDSLTARVAVDVRDPAYVPNIFSPNGDGNNDRIGVLANSALVERVVYFRIFSRWGAMVWEALNTAPGDPKAAWDGMLGGQFAPTGAYTWIAQVQLVSGEVIDQSGTTVLMKH